MAGIATVACPAHGPMRRDEPRKWWACGTGGCGTPSVTDEEMRRHREAINWALSAGQAYSGIPGVEVRP